MTNEFDHLHCPMCGGIILYSEGTHDLGCENNTKPYEDAYVLRERALHDAEYGGLIYKQAGPAPVRKDQAGPAPIQKDQAAPGGIQKDRATSVSIQQDKRTMKAPCEPHTAKADKRQCSGEARECVFGVSFTESGNRGTLWSIRIIHGQTDYFKLMSMLKKIERRRLDDKPLAANTPNLPKKIERNPITKLAFRYSLEIEDLYSIKFSSETPDRLALFYNLQESDVHRIRAADVFEE